MADGRHQTPQASTQELLERAMSLLRAVAEEAESLNAHIAVHGTGACNGVRTRVQNIHGLAVTPEVEDWGADRG